jgi:hypothetical protein
LLPLLFVNHAVGAAWVEAAVDRLDEYLKYAEECRAIAAGARSPETKANFERMAATWEVLARQCAVSAQSAHATDASEPGTKANGDGEEE